MQDGIALGPVQPAHRDEAGPEALDLDQAVLVKEPLIRFHELLYPGNGLVRVSAMAPRSETVNVAEQNGHVLMVPGSHAAGGLELLGDLRREDPL